MSRLTTRTNHSPPRLELQEPAQRHMVSRAQRETTKSKHMHFQFSATTRPPQELGAGSCTFEARLVLPVSTTSYSRHAVSTVQSPISTADNERSLTDSDGAKAPRNPVLLPYLYIIIISPSDLTFSIYSISKSNTHVLEYQYFLYLASNQKLLDF